MKPANDVAIKEWAVVCEALAEGQQTVLLRKGGIDEGPEGFQVQHREFWLFPTNFHQDPEELVDEAGPLLDRLSLKHTSGHVIRLALYAVVEDVVRITHSERLARLEGWHILAESTVAKRFIYREPGLNVLALRIYRSRSPVDLADTPYFAGCRSWVKLPQELSTAHLTPILSDAEFSQRMRKLRAALAT